MEDLKKNLFCLVTYSSKELQGGEGRGEGEEEEEERRERRGEGKERKVRVEKKGSHRGKNCLPSPPPCQMGMCGGSEHLADWLAQSAAAAAREQWLKASRRQAAWQLGAEHR